MPASLSSCAGTIGVATVEVGQELVRLLADAATDDEEIRREERLELEVLVEPLRPLLPRQVLRLAHAVGGASFGVVPAQLEVAELGVGHERAVDEQRAPDAGAERDHHHDAASDPTPAPNSISATPAASASFTTVTGAPIAFGEERRRVGADPLLVDVGRGEGHALLDDRGERCAGRALPVEEGCELTDHLGDRLGGGRMGREDAVAVGEELAGGDVDRRTLDAGSADVDAEHGCHAGILVQIPAREGSPVRSGRWVG